MAPALWTHPAPVPPPSYHRTAATALHLDALTLVTRLELLALCRLAVRLAQRQCPPPLPAGPGGAPRVDTEETLLLLALLRTLWRLSYQELHDWLCAWPALALACGLPPGPDGCPRAPSKAQQSKRLRAAGAPASEMQFVLLVRAGLWMGLSRARDLIIDIPMRPSAMPRPTIPARSCVATASIPCSVAGPASLCSSGSPAPTSTMRPLLARCWSWPCGCSPCARRSCVWMRATGASS